MKIFRWKAIIPIVLVLLSVAAIWILLLDTIVERTVERIGTEIVGARVELDEADVRLTEGFVALRGLRVTNPDAPMTNLFEASEIIADLRMVPLLEKKIYIDTVAVRELRFGTARETSGAIEGSTQTNRAIRNQIDAWTDQIRIPEFSLEGLGQAVNVDAIRPESLQTPMIVRELISAADTSRAEWETRLTELNPAPAIDSGRALLERLQTASLTSLGVTGLVQTLRSARTVQGDIESLAQNVGQLDDRVREGVGSLRDQLNNLSTARDRDLAFARSLLRIPSLDGPDLSPSIFGTFAVSAIRPLLYWTKVAERYVPSGLDPRRRPGPQRLRMAGEDVSFPGVGALPKFTLAFGEATLELGGTGVSAGAYAARLTGLSSAPRLHGAPLRVTASRTAAAVGPTDLSVDAVADRTGESPNDSVRVNVAGISLPSLEIPGLNATLDLGTGTSRLSFERTGGAITGSWQWRAASANWTRQPSQSAGIAARVEDLLWSAASAVRDVELEVRFSGDPDGPNLSVRSNVGSAISRSIRQQLSQEIAAAEAQVRAEVNRLVGDGIATAQERVAALEQEIVGRVNTQRTALDDLRTQLQERIRELTRLVPGGIGIDD